MGPVTLQPHSHRRHKSKLKKIRQHEPTQAMQRKGSHLDLFVGGDGTKDDLCEALRWKHPEADASNHAAVLDQ